jgi:hypothetical protein
LAASPGAPMRRITNTLRVSVTAPVMLNVINPV